MASTGETIDTTIPSMLNLLKSGIENAIEHSTPKNITVVLGLPGSHKRDLVQFISGNEQLYSLNDFTASSTAFPGLIVDLKTNTAFYEYPKFGESKTVEEEISAALLFNKIVDYADSIKLIFVIPDLSENKVLLDDDHIDSLIDDSVKIIKNFDEVKDSIALVATKVDNFIDDEGNPVSDEDVITSITESLNHKQYSRPDELSFIRKQNFINILLKKKDKKYTNIAIFKKPRILEGTVSENDILQDNKRSLEIVINVNTKFTIHDKNNFQCASCLDKLMNDLQSGLSKNIMKIKQIALEYFENPANQSQDLDELYLKYISGYKFFNELDTISYNSIKDFLTIFFEKEKETKFNIKIPEEIIQNLNNYPEYMGLFLRTPALNSSKYSNFAKIDKEHLSILLAEVKENLAESQAWYAAVIALRDVLNKYEIRGAIEKDMSKIRKLHDIANPNRCNKVGKMTEDEQKQKYDDIKESIIETIEKILMNPDKDQFRLIEAIVSNIEKASIRKTCRVKLNVLSEILNFLFFSSLDDGTAKSCLSGTFKIKGKFLKLSDVSNNEVIKRRKCAIDKSDVKEIRLFASDRVYIDDDFEMIGDEVQLSIIAPTWEVVGKHKIVLDGKPGANYTVSIAPPPNLSVPGNNGTDGLPGQLGGPAGTFLGIGLEFINGENLTISATGGKGGQGQMGSNGVNGTEELLTEDQNELASGSLTKYLVKRMCDLDRIENDYLAIYYCEEYARPCKNGGNGGRGGAGGRGGKAGKIEIIELHSFPSNIEKHATEGEVGMNGRHGIGGHGGSTQFFHFELQVSKDTPPERAQIQYNRIFKWLGCAGGQNYSTSFNSIPMELPSSSEARISANAVNDYKVYLRDIRAKVNVKIRDKFLREFLNYTEENQLVKELYNAEGFVDELNGLESQFHALHKKLSFLPFYESLLHRITQYADWIYEQKKNKNFIGGQNFLEDESKALRYLYTATLSKIFGIRDNKSSNLIFDVVGYLDSIMNRINQLKESKKITLIDDEHEKYYDSLDRKIEEAKDFGPQITREIEIMFANVEAKIESLIGETESLEDKVQGQMYNLEETQKKLENAILLRSYFAIPKMIGTFLNFAGPVGATVGAAITGSAMVIESLCISDVKKDNIKVSRLLDAFNQNFTTIENLFDQRDKFQAQLDAIVVAFNTTEQSAPPPLSVRELKKTILNIKGAVEEEKKGSVSLDKISEKIDKVIPLLEKQATELGGEKYKNNETIQAWSNFMSRAVNVIKIIQVPVSLYKDIAEDNEKNKLVVRAYKEAEDQLKKMDAYKKNIRDKIIPQCRKLQEFITEELSGEITRKNSLAALNISKWKMQGMLNTFKFSLRKITQEFKVQEDITRLIEKIDGALTTMISVYDCLQEYHDKKELADYIQNINPISGNTEMMIENEHLKKAVDKLKVTVQSNIVLEEYERAVHAVKQTVYPLAYHFVDRYQFKLFDNSNSGNITSLAANAANHLNAIRQHFKENRLVLRENDRYIIPNAEFITEVTHHRGAFYTWKYAENKYAISQLLRGEEITLKSDITRGLQYSAIKFREIGIHFVFANKTIEREFKKELEPFDLDLVHLGNSQYRCKNKFHTITNNITPFFLEFFSSTSNLVTTKLKEHQAMLSPYASWNLTLSSPQNRSFDALIRYENMTIDLALEGKGSYLYASKYSHGIDRICNENVSKYYIEDKTILEITPTELYNRKVLNEIPGLGEPIIKDQENHSRKRRSLGDHEFKQDIVEEDPFSTSGACSNIKFSFINNIFNLIGTGLVAYEYLNPVNKIRQWFAKHEINTNQEYSFVLDSNVPSSSMKMLNIQNPVTESPKISKMFIDDELPTANNLLNDASFCNHGNLLLLDLVIRSKSGVKYSHPCFAVNANVDRECAQHLAYREHHK